jgi:hypothetical protein
MAGSYLIGKRCDFRSDAIALVSEIRPPIIVPEAFPAPLNGGYVITINHYWRPGFSAMWIGLAISAAVPFPVQWTMTSAWYYSDFLRSKTITPLSRWVLKKIASSYGFILMPPMPPRPEDVTARSGAVRLLLRYVESNPHPIVAIAPEGVDSQDGCLTSPPNGFGRLMYLFIDRGLHLLPCGIFEAEGYLHLQFGEPFKPSIDGLLRQDREFALASITMKAIATCLPEQMRGPYA